MAKKTSKTNCPVSNRESSCCRLLARNHFDTIVCVAVLAVLLMAAITISYYSYWQQTNAEREKFTKEFDNLARIVIARFVASMQQAANTAELVAAAFKHETLSGTEFRELVAPSIESGATHSAFQGMAFCPLVDNTDRKAFEELALNTDYGPGLPDGMSLPPSINMGIWQSNSSNYDQVPVPEHAMYAPVYLVYPLEYIHVAVGFDNYVIPSRRFAIDYLLAAGRTATTDIVQLVPGVYDRPSCLVMSPVYDANGTSLDHIKGVILSVVVLDGFFESVLPEFVQEMDVVLRTSLGTAYTLHLHRNEVRYCRHLGFASVPKKKKSSHGSPQYQSVSASNIEDTSCTPLHYPSMRRRMDVDVHRQER